MPRILLSMFFLILLNSCSTTKTQSQQSSLSITATTAGDQTELSHCQVLFERTCQRCHKLPQPVAKTEEQWNKILPIMAGKANISEATKDSIAKYILTSRLANK